MTVRPLLHWLPMPRFFEYFRSHVSGCSACSFKRMKLVSIYNTRQSKVSDKQIRIFLPFTEQEIFWLRGWKKKGVLNACSFAFIVTFRSKKKMGGFFFFFFANQYIMASKVKEEICVPRCTIPWSRRYATALQTVLTIWAASFSK